MTQNIPRKWPTKDTDITYCILRWVEDVPQVRNPFNIAPKNLQKIPHQYRRHLKVFSKAQAKQLPPSRPWDHGIDLKPDAPASLLGKTYPLTQQELEAMNKHIDEQLAKGYIRPSISLYTTPFFFIKKKDSSLRPIYDYRKLNKWTIWNHYPLSLITELIYRLCGCNRFTKVDICDGYYNLLIKEKDH